MWLFKKKPRHYHVFFQIWTKDKRRDVQMGSGTMQFTNINGQLNNTALRYVRKQQAEAVRESQKMGRHEKVQITIVNIIDLTDLN